MKPLDFTALRIQNDDVYDLDVPGPGSERINGERISGLVITYVSMGYSLGAKKSNPLIRSPLILTSWDIQVPLKIGPN